MIAPLLPYGIKGAIWYQGEANVNRAFQYRTAFPAMIQDWRSRFKQGDFPFYFVQIAPHPYNWDNASCELREAQVWTRRHVKRTGIVVPSDITPNVNDIHPSFKQPVGQRLARIAFSRLYGAPILEDESPLYRSMKVEGERVRLSFDNAQRGLQSKDATLSGFLIAGPDRKFVRAEARIEGSEIVVWSAQVQRPEAVRYGWTDISTATVWNVSGLPLSCFRTDQWPGVTQNARW